MIEETSVTLRSTSLKCWVNLYVVMHHNPSALFLPLTQKVDVKPISGSKKQHLSYGVLSVIRDNDPKDLLRLVLTIRNPYFFMSFSDIYRYLDSLEAARTESRSPNFTKKPDVLQPVFLLWFRSSQKRKWARNQKSTLLARCPRLGSCPVFVTVSLISIVLWKL